MNMGYPSMFTFNIVQSDGRCLSKDFISIDDRMDHEWEKMNKILAVLVLIISLMGCVAALNGQSWTDMRPGEAAFEHLFNQGIGQPWIGGNPPWAQGGNQATLGAYSATSGAAYLQYSQYYTMPSGPTPSTHITAPEQFDIAGNTPTTIYFSGQNQAVPYSQYQTYATYIGGNSLWIKGSTSWTQYAQVPRGAILSLISTTPTAGSGYLYEIYPDGKLIKKSYNFYPYNWMSFYADTIGQHILLFSIGNQVSNAVMIDVAGYEVSYQPIYQPIYQPPYQPPYQQPYQPPGHPPLTY
jgi:hypothetical protein